MAEEYVKTSKEELTAMAIDLRKSGSFDEGQKFVFPSKYAKPATITYWIYDENETEPWIEKTASQAETLVEGGASILEVEERPETGESNTVYQVFTYQMGFKEAYEKAIGDFYMKVRLGTLTQQDVEGIVYSQPVGFFSCNPTRHSAAPNAFPDIEELTIDASLLSYYLPIIDDYHKEYESFSRLTSLKKINLINSTGTGIISSNKFRNCKKLEELNYKPISLESYSFCNCESIQFGEGKLDLSECLSYGDNCFRSCNFDSINIAEGCTEIGASAFEDCQNLQSVYLPSNPPDLGTNAFEGTHTNLTFYVASGPIKTAYSGASNWSDLISRFEVIEP